MNKYSSIHWNITSPLDWLLHLSFDVSQFFITPISVSYLIVTNKCKCKMQPQQLSAHFWRTNRVATFQSVVALLRIIFLVKSSMKVYLQYAHAFYAFVGEFGTSPTKCCWLTSAKYKSDASESTSLTPHGKCKVTSLVTLTYRP